MGGVIWLFQLISGRETFISSVEVLSIAGKKLVQLCHSSLGLNEKPAKPCGLPNSGLLFVSFNGFSTMVFWILARCFAAKYCIGGMSRIFHNSIWRNFSRVLTNPIPAAALVLGVCFTLPDFARTKGRSLLFTKTILPMAPLRLPFFFNLVFILLKTKKGRRKVVLFCRAVKGH